MEFKFDETAMRAVLSQVLFEQMLTPERRDELVQGAIADLLKDKEVKDGYSTKRVSVISDAFNYAARQVATEVVREEVSRSEEFRDAVRAVLRKAIDAILTDEKIGESAASVVVDLIVKALENYRNY